MDCHFATHPRKSRTAGNNDTPEAPNYGLLIRRDGLTVPRCGEFVARSFADILGAEPGKVALPREATLSWFRHLLKRDTANYHTDVLPRFLPWLTHSGDSLDQRLKRIQDLWQELWDVTRDAQIARLLSVLVGEVAANNYHHPLHLINPTTGEIEEGMDIAWRNVLGGHIPYDYPSDWPRPWNKSDGGKHG